MTKMGMTREAKAALEARKANEAFARHIYEFKTAYKKRLSNEGLADALNISLSSAVRYQTPDGVGKMDLNTARRIAQSSKMPPEAWLKVGGY